MKNQNLETDSDKWAVQEHIYSHKSKKRRTDSTPAQLDNNKVLYNYNSLSLLCSCAVIPETLHKTCSFFCVFLFRLLLILLSSRIYRSKI
jgi:hypothetical protein